MTSQEQYGELTLGAPSANKARVLQASRGKPRHLLSVSGPAEKLIKLLCCDPLDLGRICGQIRAHPEIESLVLRMAGSLGFLPEAQRSNVEEAAVGLGKNRLRVIAHMWSCVQGGGLDAPRDDRSRLIGGDRHVPETRYLEAFLNLLGAETKLNPDEHVVEGRDDIHLQTEDLTEWTDLFVRDLMSLAPHYGPTLDKRTALACSANPCRKEVE